MQLITVCCGLTIGMGIANALFSLSVPLLVQISPVIICVCFEFIYHLGLVYTEMERQRKWFEECENIKKEIV